MTDHPQSLDDLIKAQKHCPQCGYSNRLTAKVCVNCGFRFPAESTMQPDDTLPNVTLRTGVVPLVRVPGKPTRAKTCPECGTVVDIEAKFCPTCGHRFSTDFSKPVPPPRAVPPPAPIGEPPIVQMPSTGVEVPATRQMPVNLPDLPPLPPLPPPPTPIVPVTAPPAVTPPANVDASADESLDGTPAPDLTDVDLARLRRRNFR